MIRTWTGPTLEADGLVVTKSCDGVIEDYSVQENEIHSGREARRADIPFTQPGNEQDVQGI